MTPRVADILEAKGRAVWTVGPEETVYRALEMMAEKNIGAVVVVDDLGRVAGMFSERHYAREVILKGRSSPKTAVRDVMRAHPDCVAVDDPPERCMTIMAEKNLRYLPVIDGERLVGVVSMGDLLRSCIADREYDIKQLTGYIRGTG